MTGEDAKQLYRDVIDHVWPRGDLGFIDDAYSPSFVARVPRSGYQGIDEFRRYVQRYLDHFEKLLSEANESDPENLLSSTFLSADVGKLYLLLARAVGRLN